MKKKNSERLKNRLFSLMKARAKKRNKPFNLAPDEVFEICSSPCLYCGAKGSNKLKYQGLELDYNGIDRIDSARGYERGNVAPCCSFCNSLKGAMIPEHWFDFLNSVVENGFQSVHKRDETRKSKRYFKGW